MEEESLEYNFTINVCDVAKLIQEKITTFPYKFKYDVEEIIDQSFYLRFNCIQGWFIRCSFKTKVGFLKKCAMQVRDLALLITILNTLYTVSCKDRIYTFARGNLPATDMKLLGDDNRCLENETLEKVMANEIIWFKTLNNGKQFILLIKLITLADCSVVMNNIFVHFIDVLNIRSRPTKMNRSTKISFDDEAREKIESKIQNMEMLKEIIQRHFSKTISPDISSSITSNDYNTMLLKWKQFIFKYSTNMYIPQPELFNEEENVSLKLSKNFLFIDIIQKHPVWVNMSILKNLDNFQALSKTNEYWTNMAREYKAEVTARKLLDKDIAALTAELETISSIEKTSNVPPKLRKKISDITKPSLRKKIKMQNVATHNYSLISEVYKDYLADFNVCTKKIQSFPRAMKKTKTCNI